MEDEIESDVLHAARIWFIREGAEPEQAAFYARHVVGNMKTYLPSGDVRELFNAPLDPKPVNE